MARYVAPAIAVVGFLALTVSGEQAGAQPRMARYPPPPWDVAASPLIVTEWRSNTLVLHPPRPDELPATEIDVQAGLQRLRQALHRWSERPDACSRPCRDRHGLPPPGSRPSSGPGADSVPMQVGHSASGLKLTRWDRFGMTLTAPNPWRVTRDQSAEERRAGGPAPPTPAGWGRPAIRDWAGTPSPDGRQAIDTRVDRQRQGGMEWVNPPPLSDYEIAAAWEAVETHPTHTAFQALADALFSRADWSGLLEAAGRWLAFAPQSPDARQAIGMACLSLGRFDQAVSSFQAIAETAEGDPLPADRAGVLLMLTHRADLAEPLFLDAMAADPANPVPVHHLAIVLWELERPDEAVQVIETFLRQHPDVASSTLKDDLALLYHATLAAGGDDWAIRQRAARRGVDIGAWDDIRIVLDWTPRDTKLIPHLVHEPRPGSGRLETPAVREAVRSGAGLTSIRVGGGATGRWYVGAGTAGAVRAPVHATAMVIAPAFQDRISLVLIQPFVLVPGPPRVRHVMTFDLPGGPIPPEIEGETRIEP